MSHVFPVIYFLIKLIIEFNLSKAFTKPCNVSLQTVQFVSKCPTNQTSYEIAARNKNCSSLLREVPGCDSIQYHCVLSEDLQNAVEVCAPSINIIDHVCAKFSTVHESVMRVDGFGCNKCPYSYNSANAFEYQECYTNLSQLHTTEPSLRTKQTSQSEHLKTGHITHLESSSDENIAIPVTVTILAVIFAFITGIIIYRTRAKWRCWAGNQNEDSVRFYGVEQGAASIEQSQVLLSQEPTYTVIDRNKLDSFQPSSSSRFPAYRNYKTRVLSFGEIMSTETIGNLAAFGFFYEGVDLKTTCFHCGCKKSNWTEQDDILKTHLSLDESCAYLQYIN